MWNIKTISICILESYHKVHICVPRGMILKYIYLQCSKIYMYIHCIYSSPYVTQRKVAPENLQTANLNTIDNLLVIE